MERGRLVALVAMFPLLAAFNWLMLRRRFLPGTQALRWVNGSAVAAWRAFDGGDPPADIDQALGRLEGRADDEAVAMRASWLAGASRTADLHGLLDAWRPADPVNAARRARFSSVLLLLDGVVDDLRPAWEAASVIADPSERVDQQVKVLIEDARRTMGRDEDPFPRLVEAHRLLGPRAAEFDTDEDRRAIRRARRMVAALGLLPAAIIVVIGIVAWSGMLG